MNQSKPLDVVILAAGNGKRMKSALPKVLHGIGGKPMLVRVIETALQLDAQKVHVVCGEHMAIIKQAVDAALPEYHARIQWIHQETPQGTGHAVKCALPFLSKNSQVLVLFGDVPLIQADTLKKLREKTGDHTLGLLLVNHPDPFGFGRVIRDDFGKILEIVEEKDALPEQKDIREIFPGILLATAEALNKWLPQLQCHNAQEEYYLTDIVKMASSEGLFVISAHTYHPFEVQGVNDRLQLAFLERTYQTVLAKKFLQDGVHILDFHRFDIRGELFCGQDTTIDINVIFEGVNHIGRNCVIGPHCVIKNSTLADGVIIHANSVLDGVNIASGCEIGPFARLRPGTVLDEDVKIGNFMEVKKSRIGRGSKASHLSYLGDALIGANVNIGAGTITCNYDGINKHQTIIEDGAFIGSDTQLVAPVRVGKNATLGAGTTLRKEAPAGELTISDIKQRIISGWKRPKKRDK